MDFSGKKKKTADASGGFLDSFITALAGAKVIDSTLAQSAVPQSDNVIDMSRPLDTIHYNQDYQMSNEDEVNGFFFDKGFVSSQDVENARALGLGPMLAGLFNKASGRTERRKATRINSATDNEIARSSRANGDDSLMNFQKFGLNKLFRGAK